MDPCGTPDVTLTGVDTLKQHTHHFETCCVQSFVSNHQAVV